MQGEGEPSFTYSIGVNKKQNKPDVVILGLKAELAHSMANRYRDRALNGETFESGTYYSDFLDDFDIIFINISKKHFKKYFGWGIWLHDGDDFEMLQMIWPTTDGVWPWDENGSDFYKWAQPILNDDGVLYEI